MNRNLFGILVIKKLLVEFCLTVFKSVSIPRTFCEDHLKLSHVYFMNVYIELFRNVCKDIHEWLDRAVGEGRTGSLQGSACTCVSHGRPFCPLDHISVMVVLSSFPSYSDFMAVR